MSLGEPAALTCAHPVFPILYATSHTACSSAKHNGYIHSAGTAEARRAIAAYVSTPTSGITEDDVVIGSGCSGALDLAITALMNPGDNLLIPQPAFALYQTLCESKGMSVKHYRLVPERQWEADVGHLESLIDGR